MNNDRCSTRFMGLRCGGVLGHQGECQFAPDIPEATQREMIEILQEIFLEYGGGWTDDSRARRIERVLTSIHIDD